VVHDVIGRQCLAQLPPGQRPHAAGQQFCRTFPGQACQFPAGHVDGLAVVRHGNNPFVWIKLDCGGKMGGVFPGLGAALVRRLDRFAQPEHSCPVTLVLIVYVGPFFLGEGFPPLLAFQIVGLVVKIVVNVIFLESCHRDPILSCTDVGLAAEQRVDRAVQNRRQRWQLCRGRHRLAGFPLRNRGGLDSHLPSQARRSNPPLFAQFFDFHGFTSLPGCNWNFCVLYLVCD